MADESYRQLENLWISAGGRRSLAPVMAAIAEAESSGNPDAYNPSGATGLWQILGAVNPADQGSLTDPNVNAHEAVLKYDTQGLGAWVTYTSGAYKQFLHGNNVPPGAASAPGGTPGGGDIKLTADPVPGLLGQLTPGLNIIDDINSLGGIGKVLGVLSNNLERIEHGIEWLFVPNHWVRIICFVLGVPLVGAGILTMTKGAQPIPVQAYGVSTEISGGQLAPAIGIAEVTVGAILLFVAFHNLQANNVNDVGGLISYLQGAIQNQATSTTPGGWGGNISDPNAAAGSTWGGNVTDPNAGSGGL